MNNSVIIGFYGLSNAGKTTLITRLIEELTKKDYKVASMKQTTHTYSIDKPGKDTWKHAEAGAGVVCFKTAVETSFIIKKDVSIEKIIQIMNAIDCFDIVLIEGARNKRIQKIRLNEETPLRDNTVFTFDGDINKMLLFIVKQIKKRNENNAETSYINNKQ